MPTAKGFNVIKSQVKPKTGTNFNTRPGFYPKRANIRSSGTINEYIFLTEEETGRVIIIDANTYELVHTYNLPEIKYSVVAIIVNKFYNIDTKNGTIMTADVSAIMNNQIRWSYDGWFPREQNWIRNAVAVHRSYIYFITFSGILYKYDTDLKTVERITRITSSDWYASLVVANDVLYISKYTYLYSYNGSALKSIATPDKRNYFGFFQDGNRVCRVGGNKTDVYPDPVQCYDPSFQVWTNGSYVNQARWYPAVVATRLRTHIFGGHCWYASDGRYQHDLNSSEVFDHQKKSWAYIPTPLSEEPGLVQAVSFYY